MTYNILVTKITIKKNIDTLSYAEIFNYLQVIARNVLLPNDGQAYFSIKDKGRNYSYLVFCTV